MDGLTATRLRTLADEKGYPVSHKQFTEYRKWHLVPDPDPVTKRWDAENVDRLIRIREAEADASRLSRRTLLLRREPLFHHIPPGRLRRAMMEVIPSIKAPVRKMKRIDAASGLVSGAGGRARHAAHPFKEVWLDLLMAVDPEVFANRVEGYYFLAQALNAVARGTEHDLSDIPFEEQIVLLTIRDLARLQGQREG